MCRPSLPRALPSLLLVLVAGIDALPPPREISPRRTSSGPLYAVNDGGYAAYVPSQRHHPMSNSPVRQSYTEENFNPSNRRYVSADPSRFSLGSVGHPLPQHNHEKIVNNNNVGRRAAGDIVFPDKAMNFTPKEDVRNCSEDGSNICDTNVQDYPYHYIEEVIANSAYDFSSYFQDDHVEVATRIDADANEDSVCDSDETILYPKVGQTADDQTLFIVNNDGNYKQGVRVEKCRRKEQSPCDPKLVVPTGFMTHCKQKYIYRKLLALQPNGEPVPDNFRIPSCCSCYISKDLVSYRGRFGTMDQPQTPAIVRQ